MSRRVCAVSLALAALLVVLASAEVMAAAGMRLDGEWEVCFTDSSQPPVVGWEKAPVPGLFPVRPAARYLWCRASLPTPSLPQDAEAVLSFGGVKYGALVFLNGQEVGGHRGGYEPFDIDVTGRLEPGRRNQLVVRVSDVRACFARPPDDLTGRMTLGQFDAIARDNLLYPIGSQMHTLGIWDSVWLWVRPKVHIADVFVITSVREHKITAQVEIANHSAQQAEGTLRAIVVDENGTVLELPPQTVTLPAGSTQSVALICSWKDPRLWSLDQPNLYTLRTSLETDAGKDEVDARFGFREFWTDGPDFYLNGTKIHLLGTASHPLGFSKEDALRVLRTVREANAVIFRVHAQPLPDWWYEAADELGVLLVHESALWCFASCYRFGDDAFWQNASEHIRAQVRKERNHPSIVLWSAENELLLTGGWQVPGVEAKVGALADVIREVDPTRPVMFDGDADPAGRADVINLHYPHEFPRHSDYPNTAYWLEKGDVLETYPRGFFAWDRKKPLYIGEFLWLPSASPDQLTGLLGDAAYVDYYAGRNRCRGLSWKYQIEAYRYAGVSGMCPWNFWETGVGGEAYQLAREAYSPVTAFIRDYPTRFFAGQPVERKLAVYNDSLSPASLTVRLQAGGVIQHDVRVAVGPAQKAPLTFGFPAPEFETEQDVPFVVIVLEDGKEKHRTEQILRVVPFPKPSERLPEKVLLYDPANSTGPILDRLGIATVPVSSLSQLPPGEVLVIGAQAFTEGEQVGSSSRDSIAAFLNGGGRVVVLEQSAYPKDLLPLSLVQRPVTIAFPRATHHPVLLSLQEDWLRFWQGDNVVARKSIQKPPVGNFKALVDAGTEAGLELAQLAEVRAGNGSALLSQLLLVEKFNQEPAAARILTSLLEYAAETRAPFRRAWMVCDDAAVKGVLARAGAHFTDVTGHLAETDLNPSDVLFAAGHLSEIVKEQDKVRGFIESGGVLFLHQPTPADVANLAALLPPEIALSATPCGPALRAADDELTDGISNQELYWLGQHEGLPWDPTAPDPEAYAGYFVLRPQGEPKIGVLGRYLSPPPGETPPLHLVQGQTMAVFSGGTMEAKVTVDKAGLQSLLLKLGGTPLGGIYPRVEVFVDGRQVGSVQLRSAGPEEHYLMAFIAAGEHLIGLRFANDAYSPPADRNLIIYSLAVAPVASLENVVFVTNPPVLLRVKVGNGLVVLDEMNWQNPGRNAKRAFRYLSTLLTNASVELKPGG